MATMNSASVLLPSDAPLSEPRRSGPRHGPPARSPNWPVAILGVPFDSVSSADALARMEQMIASRNPHYVVTANVDFLVQAHQDVELRRILIDADLVLCDGTPLLWASRWLGNALPERVAGSDLTPLLLRRAAERGHRVFFLGAGPGVAAHAAARLQREYPHLRMAGHYSPPVSSLLEMDHAAIVQRIRDAAPDILLVSFGCPKQEKWISMHYRSLGVPVCIGVGATLDFLAGRVKRAPAWMRRSGCEWVYRLMQEPRRLYRRYAADACGFVPAIAAQRWRMSRRRRAAASAPSAPQVAPEFHLIDAGEALTRAELEQHAAFWAAVPQLPAHCLVDLSRIEHIDATGFAFLVKCRKALQRRSHVVVLIAPTEVVRRALVSVGLADFFTVVNDLGEARQFLAATGPAPVVKDETRSSVTWSGEISAANVDEVWDVTLESLGTLVARGSTLVTIGMAAVPFIDSAAAGMMVRLKKWAQERNVQVFFTAAQANVRNVLRISRLDHLLLEGGR